MICCMRKVFSMKPCQQCGSLFKAYTKDESKYPGSAFKFCSQGCYHLSSRTLKEIACPRCHAIFRPADRWQKHCSRACAFARPSIEKVIADYESGDSLKTIGIRHGRSFATIRRMLIANGTHLRTELRASFEGGKPFNFVDGKSNTIRRLATNFARIKKWRSKVFRRDKYTCVKCGAKSGNGVNVILNADHIKRWAEFPRLRYRTSNGQTLCEKCHREKTKEEGTRYWKNQYS